MKSRKELKKSGLKVLKKHYAIFILLCLIAAFIGSEFSNSISITKLEKQVLPKENQVVNNKTQEVKEKVYEDASAKTNIDPQKQIETLEKKKDKIEKKYSNNILSNKRGVFAGIVNMVDSGSLYLTMLTASKSIIGSNSKGIIISIILSLIIYGFYWFFFVNIYKVMMRRLFLEGGTYEKISIKDLLFIFHLKKWMKVTKTMARLFLYEFLWGLTIVGGIIKRYSYYLVPYIVAENPDIDGKDAIKLSRDMMNGHKMECFILDLSFILWDLLGGLTLGLSNIFFTDAYKIAVFSQYYVMIRKISKDKKIKNIDLLCDKYLYEKADTNILRKTYYEDIKNIEITDTKPTNFKEKIEDILGINLSNRKKEEEYEQNKINQLLIRNITDEGSGKSYPNRLYFIEYKKKRKRFEVVNYLRRYSIPTLILIFFIFASVGWLWEVLLHILNDGAFVNRGVMHGPWLPIYGFGGVLALCLLNKFRDRPILEFICIIVICGIIEYFTSYFLEIFNNGEKWWDYSGYFLNLNGRICAEGLLVFGLGGMAAVYIIAPIIDNIIKRFNYKKVIIISIILVTLFTIDHIYSSIYPNMGDGITSYYNFVDNNIYEKVV